MLWKTSIFMLLRRIGHLLQYTVYYGAYKFALFHIPALGYMLRQRNTIQKRKTNISIGGVDYTKRSLKTNNLELILDDVNVNTILRNNNNLLNIPLITKDNIVMIPIHTLQSVDITEPNNDIQNIPFGSNEYPIYNKTLYSGGDIQISYLELMSMPVARFHFIWNKYINTMINNEYYKFDNDFNYIVPFANLYIFNFTPDLKYPLNIYEFVKVMPTSDIAVKALNGAINDVDLVETTVLYRYETIRRHIITDIEIDKVDIDKSINYAKEKLYTFALYGYKPKTVDKTTNINTDNNTNNNQNTQSNQNKLPQMENIYNNATEIVKIIKDQKTNKETKISKKTNIKYNKKNKK